MTQVYLIVSDLIGSMACVALIMLASGFALENISHRENYEKSAQRKAWIILAITFVVATVLMAGR